MIERHLEPFLRLDAGYYPVVTLTGPRQSGKTTLARKVFPDRCFPARSNPVPRFRIPCSIPCAGGTNWQKRPPNHRRWFTEAMVFPNEKASASGPGLRFDAALRPGSRTSSSGQKCGAGHHGSGGRFGKLRLRVQWHTEARPGFSPRDMVEKRGSSSRLSPVLPFQPLDEFEMPKVESGERQIMRHRCRRNGKIEIIDGFADLCLPRFHLAENRRNRDGNLEGFQTSLENRTIGRPQFFRIFKTQAVFYFGDCDRRHGQSPISCLLPPFLAPWHRMRPNGLGINRSIQQNTRLH